MTWPGFAYTHDPFKATVKFLSSLAGVLMLTFTLEVYAVLPGNHLHPATVVMVLFFASWIGVSCLAAAILIPMVLVVRTGVRAPWPSAISDAQREAAAPAWTVDGNEGLPHWIRDDVTLDLALAHEFEHSSIYEPVTVPAKGNDEFAQTEDREVCECVGG